MKNKTLREECKTCNNFEPYGWIPVEDVRNPICPSCGEKLLTFGYSDAEIEISVVGKGDWKVKIIKHK